MPDHRFEIALLWCVLLNGGAMFCGWRLACRWSASFSQRLLDAFILLFTVQYLAVGIPGILHLLGFSSIAFAAVVLSGAMLLASRGPRAAGVSPVIPRSQLALIAAVIAFAVAFVGAFAVSQANLPVISIDAMTYHFPAAVQWLQDRRIDLFQTWFFNPANTYSPLGGSTLITWWIAPFGNDILARFVQVPALLAVGVAVHQLARQLGARPLPAVFIAAAAVLCRPIFLQSMMGKDDLYLSFFFLATLTALSAQPIAERSGAVRLGICAGLLLAMKYTVLLAAPMLLLAMGIPTRSKWTTGRWALALLIAVLLAGPWYLRNWLLTANPLFPLQLPFWPGHALHGLFTSARSEQLQTLSQAMRVLTGHQYGVPMWIAGALALAWLAAIVRHHRTMWGQPVLRAVVFGPVLGTAIFCLTAPFPEVRFVAPVVLMLIALAAVAAPPGADCVLTAALAIICLSTLFSASLWRFALQLAAPAVLLATVAGLFVYFWKPRFQRWTLPAVGIALAAIVVWAYIDWTAYCRQYLQLMYDPDSGYGQQYPAEAALWRFVNETLPEDTRVDYSNIYLVYPLQGPSLKRQLRYVPVRPGMATMADLPFLGEHLSGEALVRRANRATVDGADQKAWMHNLRASGCQFLILGKGNILGASPEAVWAAGDQADFRQIYDGPAGTVYRILLNAANR